MSPASDEDYDLLISTSERVARAEKEISESTQILRKLAMKRFNKMVIGAVRTWEVVWNRFGPAGELLPVAVLVDAWRSTGVANALRGSTQGPEPEVSPVHDGSEPGVGVSGVHGEAGE